MAVERRPLVYADENVDRPLVEGLRQRGFDVLTALEAGTVHQPDDMQLSYAASIGRVILTYNRDDFRREHARFIEAHRTYSGIVLLPQGGHLTRRVVRASMLLDWWATLESVRSRLINWNDLQVQLHRGYRVPGYAEDELREALGREVR